MKRIITLILIAALLAATALAVSACGGDEQKKDFFTVVSYNTRIWDMTDWEGVTHDERVGFMAAQIASVNPDVVGLQEIDDKAPRSGKRDYTAELSPAGYSGYFAEACNVAGYMIYGISTLTRTPCVGTEKKNLPNPVKQEMLDAASGIDYITISASVENRVVQRTVINVLDTQIAFYNTHTSYESPEMRVAQIQYIYELMQADEVPYKVCVGDFNSGDGVSELSPFFDDYDMCIGAADEVVTFPSSRETLDNIIYSRNLEAFDFKVHQTPHSDHYMLSASFKIKA